jgi:hypothetical protein
MATSDVARLSDALEGCELGAEGMLLLFQGEKRAVTAHLLF